MTTLPNALRRLRRGPPTRPSSNQVVPIAVGAGDAPAKTSVATTSTAVAATGPPTSVARSPVRTTPPANHRRENPPPRSNVLRLSGQKRGPERASTSRQVRGRSSEPVELSPNEEGSREGTVPEVRRGQQLEGPFAGRSGDRLAYARELYPEGPSYLVDFLSSNPTISLRSVPPHVQAASEAALRSWTYDMEFLARSEDAGPYNALALVASRTSVMAERVIHIRDAERESLDDATRWARDAEENLKVTQRRVQELEDGETARKQQYEAQKADLEVERRELDSRVAAAKEKAYAEGRRKAQAEGLTERTRLDKVIFGGL